MRERVTYIDAVGQKKKQYHCRLLCPAHHQSITFRSTDLESLSFPSPFPFPFPPVPKSQIAAFQLIPPEACRISARFLGLILNIRRTIRQTILRTSGRSSWKAGIWDYNLGLGFGNDGNSSSGLILYTSFHSEPVAWTGI